MSEDTVVTRIVVDKRSDAYAEIASTLGGLAIGPDGKPSAMDDGEAT